MKKEVDKKEFKLKVSKSYAEWSPSLIKDDYDRLEKSIKEFGIKTDLHVLPDGTILCGHTRYEIAQELKIKDEDIPYKIVDIENENERIYYIIDDNISRRHLNLAQKIRLGSQLENVEKAKAQERQQLSEGRGKKGKDKCPDLINEMGETRDKVGEKIGVSGRTYERGKKVMEERPEEFEKAEKGETTLNAIYTDMQVLKRDKAIKDYRDFTSKVNKSLNTDAKKTLNELNYKYLETSIEFANDLFEDLSNCEYTTKEDFDGEKEINVERIVRIEGYEEMKEELVELIKKVVLKMNEAKRSFEKIIKYYGGK